MSLKCKKCGYESNTPIGFCPKCGEQIEVFCYKCGKKLNGIDKICDDCGADLSVLSSDFSYDSSENNIVSNLYKKMDFDSEEFKLSFIKYALYGLQWLFFLITTGIFFFGKIFVPSDSISLLSSVINFDTVIDRTKFSVFNVVELFHLYVKSTAKTEPLGVIALVIIYIVLIAVIVALLMYAYNLITKILLPLGYMEITSRGKFYFRILGGFFIILLSVKLVLLNVYIKLSFSYYFCIILSIIAEVILLPAFAKYSYYVYEYDKEKSDNK